MQSRSSSILEAEAASDMMVGRFHPFKDLQDSTMRVRLTTLLLTTLLPCAQLWAAADVNRFLLVQDGRKPVGTASYSIEKAKDGSLKVHSKYEYKIAPEALGSAMSATPASASGGGRRGAGSGPTSGHLLFGQYIFEYRVDAGGQFINGYTEDMASLKMTAYSPSKQRDTVVVSQTQSGSAGLADPIEMPKPDYLVMPSLDASSIQILLTKALEHPAADKTYLALIQGPGGTGNSPAYIIVLPAGEAKGTLDGKPVVVKHYRLNLNKGHAEVFADESGKLMEADMDMLTTDMVRSGFKLAE